MKIMSNLEKVTRKSFVAGLSVLLSLPMLGVPVLAEPGVTDNQIVIGSCCALTGPAAKLGIDQLAGANAYISDINDHGGVNGRKIVVKKYDDGYEPGNAPAAFNKLLADKCFAGAFFVGTPTAKVYVPLAEKNKVPIVGLFTGAQLLYDPIHRYVVSIRASYADEMREQIDRMWKDLGPQKIGIIYQNDPFGLSVLDGLNKALAKYNTQPVAKGTFERNTLDVGGAINTVKAANPDVVILVGPYGPESEIVKKSHSMGWKPLFTTVSFVGTEEFIQAAGKDAEGVVVTQVVAPYNRDDLKTVALYKKLMAQYSPGSKSNFCSFEGFVDAMVLVDGLKAAGRDLTREKLITALESFHNKDMGLGPNLKLTYGPQRHKGFDSVYTTVVRDGQPVAFFNWKQVRSK
jgi:ABC-type branched-subunit amino acid transport system substrate-binding protein